MNTEPDAKEDGNAGEADPGSADLERDLTLAMRPLKLPDGFADRLLQRVQTGAVAPSAQGAARGRLLRWPEAKRWVGGAIAAGLLFGLFAGGTTLERHRQQEHRAAAATAQFETAERITDRAMEQARQQVERAGVHLDD